MPLTPKFSITQNDEFVIIEINVPWVRVGDMEFVIDSCDFSFYCNPYLLKLTFPYPCIDDERAKAVYDVDKNNGTVYVHVPKVEKGQFFPDMDLLSTILQKPTPMPTLQKGPLVQEMDNTEEIKEESAPEMKQDLLSLEESSFHTCRKYGFNNQFTNVFKSFEDCSDIIENPIPDDSTVDMEEMMNSVELTKFNKEHYMSDYMYGKEDYLYTEFCEFLPDWVKGDRVIRKQLKEMEEKPMVPLSSFDPLQHISKPEKKEEELVVKEEKPQNQEKKKVLIEIIDEEEVKGEERKDEEKKIERLDGEVHYSSLLIQPLKEQVEPSEQADSKQEVKPSEQVEPSEQADSKQEVKPSEQAEPTEPTQPQSDSSSIPVITKKETNLVDSMKHHISSTRISHEETSLQLSSQDKDLLLSIKPISISLTPSQMNIALFSLVDILCAYAYDTRITQHDSSPESAWTISILSPTLSWLIPSRSLESVLISFIRRVLIYPYLRRYDLARLCIKDCALMFKLGKRRLLKCLLDIKRIFKCSERKYILNTLYIDKYILWIQTVDYPILYDVAEEINYLLKNNITRESLNLGILELDNEAKEILKEELEQQQSVYYVC